MPSKGVMPSFHGTITQRKFQTTIAVSPESNQPAPLGWHHTAHPPASLAVIQYISDTWSARRMPHLHRRPRSTPSHEFAPYIGRHGEKTRTRTPLVSSSSQQAPHNRAPNTHRFGQTRQFHARRLHTGSFQVDSSLTYAAVVTSETIGVDSLPRVRDFTSPF